MRTKMSYRWLLSLVCLLFSCQLIAPVSQPSATPQPSPSSEPTATPPESLIPEPSPTAEAYDLESAFKAFYNSLAVSSDSNCRSRLKVPIEWDVEVRKSLLKKQTIKTEAGTQSFEVVLNATDDLKRRLLFNVRQGEVPVQSLKVNVNGQEVKSFFPENSLLRSDVPDMVLDLCSYLQEGSNTLTVTTEGEPDSSAEVFMDGFILSADIPRAWPSFGKPSASYSLSGLVNLKFLEKMKVRLGSDVKVPESEWVDLSGISLYPLHLALSFYPIERISRTFNKPYEEQDREEQEHEEKYHEGLPNSNLFYNVWIFKKEDVFDQMQEIRDVLIKIPFFEDVYFSPDPNYLPPF